MSDEGSNVELFRRLNTAEKEIYSMSKELIALQQAEPAKRLSLLEAAMQQIRSDVVNIEEISSEMSKKLGDGLTELKTQAAITRAQTKMFLGAGTFFLGAVSAWPYIKEFLKAALT